MKIVIIDGFTVNPGDLSWAPIAELGDLTVYDRTPAELVVERSRGADIIITSKVVYDKAVLAQLPQVKYIGVIATGYNVVDLEATRARNIVVTNVPNYCTSSVAQLVFAHILELARRVGHHDAEVRAGRWAQAADFCFWDFPQIDLANKTLGLIGLGHIGMAVARIGLAMDMRVIAYDVHPRPVSQIKFVELDELFATSDVISLHCPLTPQTKGVINRANLQKMKKSAYLINTGRGPLVNDNDLSQALHDNIIAGAGLDVLSVEPPSRDNPLFTAPNCFITPHIAWSSQEARTELIAFTARNVAAFMAGKPINVVNGL